MVSCVLNAGNLTMMKLVSTSKEQATASEILFANSSLSVVFLLIVSQPHTRMGPLRITIHGAVANHDSWGRCESRFVAASRAVNREPSFPQYKVARARTLFYSQLHAAAAKHEQGRGLFAD
jgi:hypothetical protein